MAVYNIGSDQTYKTISNVNSLNLQPGDQVLFKRGETFNDETLYVQNKNGTSSNKIIFGTYGTGNKPILGNNNSTTLQFGARIQNASYIVFEDLEIRSPNNTDGATGLLIAANNIEVRNCTIVGSDASVNTNVSGIVISDGSQYIHLHHNDISHFGNGVVGYAAPNTTIEYNIVHDIQRYDGNFGAYGIRLISNTFEDDNEPNWWFDYNYTGIIRGNEIYDFSRYAIDCATGMRVIVEDNHIHSSTSNSSKDQEYGSGIKAGEKNKNRLHEGTVGTIVRRNIIHNLHGGGDGAGTPNVGITTVNSCDGDIYYNLIYDIGGRGISRTGLKEDSQQADQSWTVYNNTIISDLECLYCEYQTNSKTLIKNNIFKTNHATLPALYCKTYRSQIIAENNIFTNRSGFSDSAFNNQAIHYPGGNAIINNNLENTNPLFIDESNNNYHIENTSPAINSGQILPSDKQGNTINQDIEHKNVISTHDIGAYEYSTTTATIPIAPSELTFSLDNDNNVILNWTDNSDNETGFKIERNGLEINTVSTNVTSYTDNNLDVGTYTYRVRAYNNEGDSTYSNEVSVTIEDNTLPGTGIPAPPSNVNANLDNMNIIISWVDNSNNEEGFKIQRNGNEIATVNSDVTSYTDNNLPAGTYTYSVASYNVEGTSDYIYSNSITIEEETTTGRVTRGLQVLYDFNEGSGDTINDKSGVGTPLNLKIKSSIKP